MYLTLEVRWFYRQPLPGRLLAWLEARSLLPARQPARQDHYLLLEGQAGLGIKLREGNVEVKQRLEEPREIEVGPGAVGRVARWRKWSFPLASGAAPGAAPLEELLVPRPAWLAVEKERRLQRYRLEDDSRVTPLPPEAPAGTGCEFELSRLRAGGEEWWSACFEAFGQEPVLEQALLAVAATVLTRGWPVPLEVEHSCGYAAWLQRFATTG